VALTLVGRAVNWTSLVNELYIKVTEIYICLKKKLPSFV
jgi:hypothetical protein